MGCAEEPWAKETAGALLRDSEVELRTEQEGADVGVSVFRQEACRARDATSGMGRSSWGI